MRDRPDKRDSRAGRELYCHCCRELLRAPRGVRCVFFFGILDSLETGAETVLETVAAKVTTDDYASCVNFSEVTVKITLARCECTRVAPATIGVTTFSVGRTRVRSTGKRRLEAVSLSRFDDHARLELQLVCPLFSATDM